MEFRANSAMQVHTLHYVKHYVGETSWTLETVLKEHNPTFKNKKLNYKIPY